MADVGTIDYKDRIDGFIVPSHEHTINAASIEIPSEMLGMDCRATEPNSVLISPGSLDIPVYFDICKSKCKIGVIGFGVNFALNPVCFIATEIGLASRKEILDQLTRKIQRGLAVIPRMTIKETRCQVPATPYTPFYAIAWSGVRNGIVHGMRGLWALEGDRSEGLTVRVGDLEVLRIRRIVLGAEVFVGVRLTYA